MGNIKELKQQNLMEVIEILRKHGEMSKQGIAQLMGLSNVSTHSFINELVAKGAVLSSGIAAGNYGRKAALFRLNPKYGFSVGLSLSSNEIRTATYDFASNLLSSFSLNTENVPPDKLCDSFVQQSMLSIANHQRDNGYCFGVGIAIPGIVSHRTDTIEKMINFPEFKDDHFRQNIANNIGVPVFIENDNKVCTYAIKWMEGKYSDAPIAFVGIREGLGSGILTNGKILYGSHSVAGEIGHISVDLNGPLCNCGRRGCLETYVSEKRLVNNLIAHLNQDADFDTHISAESFTINHVIALEKSNGYVQRELKKCCDYVKICLENLVITFDPEEIIIDCTYLKQLPEYFAYLYRQFYQSPWVRGKDVVLRLNTIDHIYATGAAMMVLEKVYTAQSENPLLNYWSVDKEETVE